MTETKTISIGTIVFAIVAYFLYGQSISALLGMILLEIGSGLTILISIVPFIGAYLAWVVNTTYTYPIIMGFVGLYPTWLTTTLLVIHTVLGLFITALTTAAVYFVLKK